MLLDLGCDSQVINVQFNFNLIPVYGAVYQTQRATELAKLNDNYNVLM